MTDFTPGPWFTLGWSIAADASDLVIATLPIIDPDDEELRSIAESEANARLIAAAPSLLAAAEAVLRDVDSVIAMYSTRAEPLSVFEPLRAAVALARGEAVPRA